MSDRIKGFTVVLNSDMKDEDAEKLQNAIAWFNGVLEVHPLKKEVGDFIERVRIRREFTEKILEVLAKE